MPDLRQELMELWHQVNQESHSRFRQVFRALKLPPIAMIVLRETGQEPGITVSELSRRADTAKSHISKVVDQLENEGYLEKRPDPADQRLVRVCLTDLANARLRGLETQLQTEWAQVMDQIPPEQLGDVIASLNVLLTALRRSRSPKESAADHLEPDTPST